MATSTRKASAGSANPSAKVAVRVEIDAMKNAFKRVSKTPKAAIQFLSKAGIVTKSGRLTKEYK